MEPLEYLNEILNDYSDLRKCDIKIRLKTLKILLITWNEEQTKNVNTVIMESKMNYEHENEEVKEDLDIKENFDTKIDTNKNAYNQCMKIIAFARLTEQPQSIDIIPLNIIEQFMSIYRDNDSIEFLDNNEFIVHKFVKNKLIDLE